MPLSSVWSSVNSCRLQAKEYLQKGLKTSVCSVGAKGGQLFSLKIRVKTLWHYQRLQNCKMEYNRSGSVSFEHRKFEVGLKNGSHFKSTLETRNLNGYNKFFLTLTYFFISTTFCCFIQEYFFYYAFACHTRK